MCGKVEVDGEVGDWIEKKIRISGWLGAPILWGPQAAAYQCLYVKTATATGYNSIDLILRANKESQPNSRILTLMHEAAYFYSEFIFYISRICLCRWKSYADRLPARQGSIVMSGPRNRKNMYGRKVSGETQFTKNICKYFNIRTYFVHPTGTHACIFISSSYITQNIVMMLNLRRVSTKQGKNLLFEKCTGRLLV